MVTNISCVPEREIQRPGPGSTVWWFGNRAHLVATSATVSCVVGRQKTILCHINLVNMNAFTVYIYRLNTLTHVKQRHARQLLYNF